VAPMFPTVSTWAATTPILPSMPPAARARVSSLRPAPLVATVAGQQM
jgi:hypothetical protein